MLGKGYQAICKKTWKYDHQNKEKNYFFFFKNGRNFCNMHMAPRWVHWRLWQKKHFLYNIDVPKTIFESVSYRKSFSRKKHPPQKKTIYCPNSLEKYNVKPPEEFSTKIECKTTGSGRHCSNCGTIEKIDWKMWVTLPSVKPPVVIKAIRWQGSDRILKYHSYSMIQSIEQSTNVFLKTFLSFQIQRKKRWKKSFKVELEMIDFNLPLENS